MRNFKLLVVLITTSLYSASKEPIGLVYATGNFQVENFTVWNSATLFNGSAVTTLTASARLRLNAGPQMLLAPDSRVKVSQDRTVLEKGAGQFKFLGGHAIVANKLQIRSMSLDGTVLAEIKDDGKLMVFAAEDTVMVVSPGGSLLANLTPGSGLSFGLDENSPANYTLTGCLIKSGVNYLIKDENTNVNFELRGLNTNSQPGQRVQVKGALAVPGFRADRSSVTLEVNNVSPAGGSCKLSAGAVAPISNSPSVAAGFIIAPISATAIQVPVTLGGDKQPIGR